MEDALNKEGSYQPPPTPNRWTHTEYHTQTHTHTRFKKILGNLWSQIHRKHKSLLKSLSPPCSVVLDPQVSTLPLRNALTTPSQSQQASVYYSFRQVLMRPRLASNSRCIWGQPGTSDAPLLLCSAEEGTQDSPCLGVRPRPSVSAAMLLQSCPCSSPPPPVAHSTYSNQAVTDYKIKHTSGQTWWFTPLIPAARRQRQADLWIWSQSGLYSETLSQGKNKQTKIQVYLLCSMNT